MNATIESIKNNPLNYDRQLNPKCPEWVAAIRENNPLDWRSYGLPVDKFP